MGMNPVVVCSADEDHLLWVGRISTAGTWERFVAVERTVAADVSDDAGGTTDPVTADHDLHAPTTRVTLEGLHARHRTEGCPFHDSSSSPSEMMSDSDVPNVSAIMHSVVMRGLERPVSM